MSRSRFLAAALLILIAATTMRAMWLTADPPSHARVGIVWHDEGPWTHNARNRALWGVWRTDAWNPVFIAPVFTALEYGAFRALGVGTWQARTVPLVSGLAAIVGIIAGLAAVSGRRAALIGGVLLTTNYVFLMWNRAALMESTMTAFVVIAWATYARAEKHLAWAIVAGMAAVLAWFTKASAAFFLGALVFDAAISIWTHKRQIPSYALLGVALAAAVVGFLFVLPHWAEYRFYNWQISVARKPSYTLKSFLDNASWLPVVSDLFARMLVVLAAAAMGIVAIASRLKTARPAARLLLWWLLFGFAELIVHGAGEERYYVMLIPALVALAALALDGREPIVPASLINVSLAGRIVAFAIVLALQYLVLGALSRALDSPAAGAHPYHALVTRTAILAFVASLPLLWHRWWRRGVERVSAQRIGRTMAVLIVAIACGWDVIEYIDWASTRTTLNYDASRRLGELLPPETPVQGKMANGLALDNRIRPVFVGRGFGNYEDRFDRDDVRYILTYVLPSEGEESSPGLIREILNHYPNRRVIALLDVDETPAVDRVELIDKFGGHARD